MEHRALAALMIRLVGLWELVAAMNAVPTAIGPLINPEYQRMVSIWMLVLAAFFAVGIPLLLGLLLIYFPSTVATRVLRVEGIEPKDPADSGLLERVAISAMGLWFAAQGLMDAVHAFFKWYVYRRMIEGEYPGTTGPAISPDGAANLIVAALELLLGLWLLLGSRGLVNLLTRLRR